MTRLLILLLCSILACAAERDEAWYARSYQEMAQRAAIASLPQLYYPESSFSPNHWALMLVRDPQIQPALLRMYHDDPEPRSRWNHLMILINRIERRGQTGDDRQAVLACCLAGIASDDPWLKTESIWGVGLFGDAACIPAIEGADTTGIDTAGAERERTLRALRRRPVH